MNGLEALGNDLRVAVARRATRRRRRLRAVQVVGAGIAALTLSTTVAVASTGVDFGDLDPTHWTILDRGEVDGRATYVRARENATGEESTFLEAREDGLDRYEAFLLHQRALGQAGSLPAETGATCTADQLTRAEIVALRAVAVMGPPGLPKDAAAQEVGAATRSAFAGDPCQGLDYAAERARWVYAGAEPVDQLMPGARATAEEVLR